jgi:hypothetical protein
LQFALTDLGVGAEPAQGRLEDLGITQPDRDGREQSFGFGADELDLSVGEAELEAAAQILLQAWSGDAFSLDVQGGQNKAFGLPAVLGRKAVGDGLEWQAIPLKADVVLIAGDAHVEVDGRSHGRVVEQGGDRVQGDPIGFDPGAGGHFG